MVVIEYLIHVQNSTETWFMQTFWFCLEMYITVQFYMYKIQKL